VTSNLCKHRILETILFPYEFYTNPGCATQADFQDELFINMKEVINMFLEEPENITYLAPLPSDSCLVSRSNATVEMIGKFF
jgi:predicted RNase H-like HicB family nuclease